MKKELANEDFRLRMKPSIKKMLIFLAKNDGRSQAKIIEQLVIKEYKQVIGETHAN